MINEELENAIEYEDFKRDKLKDDIHYLYEENKQLKDLLNKANDEVLSYANCCIDLQQKIDKAIEYIKENACYEEDIKECNSDLVYSECTELLEILGGNNE